MKRISSTFYVFERVYDGDDPEVLAPEALKLSFSMKLDDPGIIQELT